MCDRGQHQDLGSKSHRKRRIPKMRDWLNDFSTDFVFHEEVLPYSSTLPDELDSFQHGGVDDYFQLVSVAERSLASLDIDMPSFNYAGPIALPKKHFPERMAALEKRMKYTTVFVHQECGVRITVIPVFSAVISVCSAS